MTVGRTVILALVGAAFARTHMNDTISTDSVARTADVTSAESYIAITSLPITATGAASGMHTGTGMSTHRYSKGTIVAVSNSTSSVAAGSSTVTDTPSVASKTKTDPTTNAIMDGRSSWGVSPPYAKTMTASTGSAATGQPVSGSGVVNGVSLGLLLVSVGLTALLQM
ncbi:hypothetical protein F4802DRAFT_578662 [Xylaria palmicola]|nr:hypothetical protein F4802DRAFT_578662 [Xylaria palmicola]